MKEDLSICVLVPRQSAYICRFTCTCTCNIRWKSLSCAHQSVADVKDNVATQSHQKSAKVFATQQNLTFPSADQLKDRVSSEFFSIRAHKIQFIAYLLIILSAYWCWGTAYKLLGGAQYTFGCYRPSKPPYSMMSFLTAKLQRDTQVLGLRQLASWT